jgi:hypothetical protein
MLYGLAPVFWPHEALDNPIRLSSRACHRVMQAERSQHYFVDFLLIIIPGSRLLAHVNHCLIVLSAFGIFAVLLNGDRLIVLCQGDGAGAG